MRFKRFRPRMKNRGSKFARYRRTVRRRGGYSR